MKRKEHRLKTYDYSKANFYFITINTYKKQNIFGKIENNKMLYNDIGKLTNEICCNIYDNVKIKMICYQIMPNHIHFIIELIKDGDIKLANAISYFKSTISKKVKLKSLWDRGYYDRVIRDEKEYQNVFNYIINNPYRDKYKW